MTAQANYDDLAERQRGEDRPTNNAVRDLIGVCTSLIDLFGRETALLEAMRPAEIKTLQDEKSTLALTYEQQVKQLAVDPNCLRVVEPVLREELKAVMHNLESSRRVNEQALIAAQEANERVIRCIVEAVTEHTHQANTYGPDGGQAAKNANHTDDTISLSLNEQI